MPHLTQNRIKDLKERPDRAFTDGDYNALYFIEYLRLFNDTPKYATIALIHKASETPSKSIAISNLEDLLTFKGVSLMDRITARRLAFMEFYSLIGRKYEDLAMKRNGVMEELDKAFTMIEEESMKC